MFRLNDQSSVFIDVRRLRGIEQGEAKARIAVGRVAR
jgi:hypothetical protein